MYKRQDFGSTGNEFWTTWNDFRRDLKTDEFKAEFDDVINGLRDGDVLSGRKAMSSYCYSTPDSSAPLRSKGGIYSSFAEDNSCKYPPVKPSSSI